MNNTRLFDPIEVKRAVRTLIQHNGVYEVRALNGTLGNDRYEGTLSGYFRRDDAGDERLVEQLKRIGTAKGIYLALNPVNDVLLARANHRLKLCKTKDPTTSDDDIVRRHWLPLDVDPERPAGISSTDAEHDAALAATQRIVRELSERFGFPEPVLADSGNGGHALYAIDLDADDGGLVERFLKAADAWHSKHTDAGGPLLKFDVGNHNPARIWKFYGTLAAKGDSTDDRPHRMSRMLSTPTAISIVSREQLEAVIAAWTPAPSEPEPKASTSSTSAAGGFDVEDFLKRHQIRHKAGEPYKDGTKFVLDACPFNAEHIGGSAVVTKAGDGKLGFACHHNSCSSHDWKALREKFEPLNQRQAGAAEYLNEKSLISRSGWPAPVGDEAYTGLAGDIVRMIAPNTESDPVAILIQFLIAYGCTIGRSAYFTVDGAKHHANAYVVLVGDTAKGRKGTSWRQTVNILDAADPVMIDGHVVDGLSSGEGLIWAVRDPVISREKIRTGKTFEFVDVEADPGVADKRLLVVEGEFANVLKMSCREGNTLSVVIRNAWDSGSLRTLTKNSPAKATSAHISMIGHITSTELKRNLSVTESANGFANRFLWICVRRSKLLPHGGKMHLVDTSDITHRLNAAIEHGRTTGIVSMDKAARLLWEQMYAKLAAPIAGMAGALLARIEAQTLRLAMIYALLDCDVEIRPRHLHGALAITEYGARSVQYIFGSSIGDRTADLIVRSLDEAGDDGLTRTQLRDLFGRHRTGEINNALADLLRAKVIGETPEGTRGRTAYRYHLLRDISDISDQSPSPMPEPEPTSDPSVASVASVATIPASKVRRITL